MKNRNEIEGVIFDYDVISTLFDFSEVFINGWDYVFLDPNVFFDDDDDDDEDVFYVNYLRSIDGSKLGDKLNFYLTTFDCIPSIESSWFENYDSKYIASSTAQQWELAFAGMYFVPDNLNWCAIYIDQPGRDYIMLGSSHDLIEKIKANGECVLQKEVVMKSSRNGHFN